MIGIAADQPSNSAHAMRGLGKEFVKFYAVSPAADAGGVVNGSTSGDQSATRAGSGAVPGAGSGLGLGLVPGLGSEDTLSSLSPDMAFFQEGVVLVRAVFDPTDEQWRGLDRYDERGLLSCRNYLPSFEQVTFSNPLVTPS